MPEYRQLYAKTVLEETSILSNRWIDVVDSIGNIRNDIYTIIQFQDFNDVIKAVFRLLVIDGAHLLGRLFDALLEIVNYCFVLIGLPRIEFALNVPDLPSGGFDGGGIDILPPVKPVPNPGGSFDDFPRP